MSGFCATIILDGGLSIGITPDGLVDLLDPQDDAALKGRIHKSFPWVSQEEADSESAKE